MCERADCRIANYCQRELSCYQEVPVPTRNINLTPQMDKAVAQRIKRGQYANASEVVRAGLRALEEDEREDEAKLEALRLAIIEGEKGPFRDGPAVMAEMRERVRRRAEALTA
jgi:antitoxin ParD1/3/4